MYGCIYVCVCVCVCVQLSKHKVVLSLRERERGSLERGDVMCSQTMMSSTETRQGFKVTKAFSVAPRDSASGLLREQCPSTVHVCARACLLGGGGGGGGSLRKKLGV